MKQPTFAKTKTRKGNVVEQDLNTAVAGYVMREHKRFMNERLEVEDNWREAWSLYLGTPRAVQDQLNHILKSVGSVNSDWRHRINTGKAFEAIETIHGYLMAATFPNNEWFNVDPVSAGYADLVRVVRKYVSNKMLESNFRSHYETFLRQLLITGNSVMALPWRYETIKWKKNVKVNVPVMDEFTLNIDEQTTWIVEEQEKTVMNRPDFETLDMFECFLDPVAADPNQSAFIRRIIKSKAEVVNLINQGFYTGVDPYDVIESKPYSASDSNQDSVRMMQGVNVTPQSRLMEQVAIYEYWGDIHLENESYHDVVATVMGEYLLRFEPNPYWAGKPFVIGTAVNITQTPYGVGCIQPSMGLLHELNIITNQRLDNQELSINSMWTLKADGVLQAEEVYSEPGKVFLVGEHTDIQPVQSLQQWNVTYQETEVLEKFIDKNFGTGAMVGVGEGRSGERVTAAEIQALRDAGGNRLSNLHKHIETTSLLPILKKVFRLMQQFVKEPEVVRVAGDVHGSYHYYKVGAEQLSYDFNLKPIGADYVTDRENYIQQRLQFLQAVAAIPQMAQSINYEKILFDLVQHFGFDDPESYVKQQSDDPSQQNGDNTDLSQQQPDPLAPQAPPTDPSQPQPNMPGVPQQPSIPGMMPPVKGNPLEPGTGGTDPAAVLAKNQAMRRAVEAQLHADGGRSLIQSLTGGQTDPSAMLDKLGG